jgi:hypothetical protein
VKVIRCEPGETAEDFIARVVAAAPPLTDEAAEQIRRLLPPVQTQADDTAA